jgi:hypothetical protein
LDLLTDEKIQKQERLHTNGKQQLINRKRLHTNEKRQLKKEKKK